VGGEGIEVVLQPIRAEHQYAAGFQPAFEFVDDGIGHLLGTRTNLENRDELVLGIAGDPNPQVLLRLFDIGPQLIELDMGEFQLGEEVLVELLALHAAAGQPGADGHLPNAEDFFDGGDIDAHHQEVQDLGYRGGKGLQAIQDGMTPDGELLAAELTAQVLNAFVFAMGSVSDQGMEGLIRDQIVVAEWIGAEISLCADGLFLPTNAFAHAPGDHVLRANDRRVVATRGFGPAVRAILVSFWLENPWFGG
jgi:hypothetical protein